MNKKKLENHLEVKKVKYKKTKMEMHLLKNFVFEKIALWFTQREIAELTWYTEVNIHNIWKKIEDSYVLEMDKDREKVIKEQIMRLEGVIRKIMKTYSEEQDANKLVKLSQEIRNNSEYIAKLRWLLVNKVEMNWDIADNLLEKFNILTDNNEISI